VLIQTATIARKLQRRLRLTHLPDAVLAPETVSVIVVEDLSAPLSDEERGCMGAARQGAVAAENSIITLVRVGAPAAYDLVVTQIMFSVSADGLIMVRKPTAGLAGLTAVLPSFRDFSTPGNPTSQLGRDTQVAIPAGTDLWRGQVLASTTYRLEVDLRLGTVGDGVGNASVMIATEAVNVTLTGGFEWTESPPQG